MSEANKPIGVFDSGVGGLTVANAIKRHLPLEQLIYFGDTAHLPYGDKEPDSIRQYSVEITKFLLEQGCKAIVIACNTASSIAFDEVVKLCEGKMAINVIDPVVDHITKLDIERVGVIGTKGTIKTDVYAKKLIQKKPNLKVASLATPLLVPMIEEGFINNAISRSVIQQYLEDPILENIEALILACTHYPLIHKEIEELYNYKVRVIDSAEVVGAYLKTRLHDQELLRTSPAQTHHFYVSDYTSSFEKTTKFFFQEKIRLEKSFIWE